MLTNLNHYSALVNARTAKFARALNPRFRSDMVSDAGPMRQFFTFLDLKTHNDRNNLAKMNSFMNSVLKEDSTRHFEMMK